MKESVGATGEANKNKPDAVTFVSRRKEKLQVDYSLAGSVNRLR